MGCILIQWDLCLYKKRRLGHREPRGKTTGGGRLSTSQGERPWEKPNASSQGILLPGRLRRSRERLARPPWPRLQGWPSTHLPPRCLQQPLQQPQPIAEGMCWFPWVRPRCLLQPYGEVRPLHLTDVKNDKSPTISAESPSFEFTSSDSNSIPAIYLCA